MTPPTISPPDRLQTDPWMTDDDASAVAEHVRTLCPRLIATLLAIARAPKDDHGVDHEAGRASSDGRSPVSTRG
jgi:hypothetical protein